MSDRGEFAASVRRKGDSEFEALGPRLRIAPRAGLLAGTALSGLIAALVAANPQTAYAACSGVNTGSVTCDTANPANGPLTTVFAGTTVVNVNPGGNINTGGAQVQVTAPGNITFNNNDTTTPGGITSSGTNAIRLFYSGGATGNISYTGNAPVTLTGTGVGIVANGAGDVTITQNALVSSTGGGISAGNGGTGTGNTVVDGTGAVHSVGSGILLSNLSGTGSIRLSGSGDVTVTSGINNALLAQMNNNANPGNILIDRVGNISISGSNGVGINVLTGGSGNVEVTQVGTVSAVVAGISARNFNSSGNVSGGVHVGGSGDVTASLAAATGISATITSSSERGNILVDRNGNITAGGGSPTTAKGIVATTGGTGSVTVTGTGNVRGGATSTGAGIVGSVTSGNLLIARNGTVSGATGINATATSGSITADITSTVTGITGTAVRFTGGTNNVLLMDGPGAALVGNAVGGGASTFRLGGSGSNTFNASQITTGWTLLDKVGSSIWILTGTATYAGPVTVNGGTLLVNGNLASASSTTVNNGGTLGGTGTVKSTTVNSGGTLAPGPSGGIGTLTVTGNLAFQSGAMYLVQAGASGASLTNVTGAASLAGTVQVVSPGAKGSFDILHASGGLGGTTFAGLSGGNPNFSASLTYTATDLFLNLSGATLGAGTSLNQNQQNVANVINNFFNNGGALPPAFGNLFNLTGSNLSNALTQIDGEVATGAERSAFQLMTQFLGLMLDPFVDGRLGGFGSAGGGAINFAPEQQDNLPPDIALAYASILNKAPPPPSFEGRWTAWGSAYGGANNTNGNAAAGTNNVTTNTFGFAGGMDYHLSPNTIVGFSLAGAGTNWGLANALGTGRGDALQTGVYGITHWGPAYLAGALAFANEWFTTSRTALGNSLSANFIGQSYGARLEGGWRYGVLRTLGVTPYGAVQFQDFHTPAYSESAALGGAFGLSYNAMNATDVRTELGSRLDAPMLLGAMPVILRGRLAWAHDFVNNPSLNAAFQALPGGTFTVNGAPIPRDSALTTVGAEVFLTPRWTLLAKFDGEFANGSQTYAGSGTLRYTW